ncbi:MAG TPA: SDR family NAD(P)-dependent oxidoreductase [Coriobacteriia bacterium]|nr:SDR family NAD(P)-dependent oxidoreductase [Coriobacteriia bacterium]
MMHAGTSVVALTGGTSGIGLATVRSLLAEGAEVVAVGRDAGRSTRVEAELRREYPDARVEYVVADLSTTDAVKAAAAEIGARLAARGHIGLDALVNNAGVVSSWRMVTAEGYEQQFAVNHLAGFLLTRELLPLLERGRPARVITVGSGSHRGASMHWDDPMFTRGYHTLRAYRQSKLANVLFSAEFNRRQAELSRVRAYVFDPGLVRTDISLKSSSGIEALVWRLRSRSRGALAPEIPAGHLASLALAPDLQDESALYWRLGRPVAADPAGLDPTAGARLWALSEQLCGERLGHSG